MPQTSRDSNRFIYFYVDVPLCEYIECMVTVVERQSYWKKFGGHTNAKHTHRNTRVNVAVYAINCKRLFSGRTVVFLRNFDCKHKYFQCFILLERYGSFRFQFTSIFYFFFSSDSTSKKVANRCKERVSSTHRERERENKCAQEEKKGTRPWKRNYVARADRCRTHTPSI